MKKFIGFIVVVLAFILSGCSKVKSLDDIISSGKIVVITSADYAPYEFLDTSKSGYDKFLGADIELAKYIAKELNVELVLQNVAFELVLSEIEIGTSDLAISGFTWKEGRVGHYQISDSYFDTGEGSQGVLVRKEDFDNKIYQNLDDLNKNGVKVAGQNSSVQYDCIVEQLPNAKAEKFDLIAMGKLDLDKKIIDGIAIAEKVAQIIINVNPDKYVFLEDTFETSNQQAGLYMLCNVNNESLMNKVNEIISNMDEGLYQSWYDNAVTKAIELGQF